LWLAGERSRQAEEHVRACAECNAELNRASAPLAMFGDAVRSWAGPLQPSKLTIAVERRKPAPRWRLAWGGAALLAGLMLWTRAPVSDGGEKAARAEQDELLLLKVESGISQTVPRPMEPLARLMEGEGSSGVSGASRVPSAH